MAGLGARPPSCRPDHQAFARRFDDIGRRHLQPIEGQNAFDLRQQPVQEPEVTAGDADDRRYAFYGSGDLSFAVPSSVARAMAASMSTEIAKRGADRAAALKDAALSIGHGFRNGHHEDPVEGQQLAKLILLNCLMSDEAEESADGSGFLMEINHAAFPSWSADVSIGLTNPSSTPPLRAHYGVVAGKAEIDAIMLPRRARAAALRA